MMSEHVCCACGFPVGEIEKQRDQLKGELLSAQIQLADMTLVVTVNKDLESRNAALEKKVEKLREVIYKICGNTTCKECCEKITPIVEQIVKDALSDEGTK